MKRVYLMQRMMLGFGGGNQKSQNTPKKKKRGKKMAKVIA